MFFLRIEYSAGRGSTSLNYFRIQLRRTKITLLIPSKPPTKILSIKAKKNAGRGSASTSLSILSLSKDLRLRMR